MEGKNKELKDIIKKAYNIKVDTEDQEKLIVIVDSDDKSILEEVNRGLSLITDKPYLVFNLKAWFIVAKESELNLDFIKDEE